jgi:hypothetical protein
MLAHRQALPLAVIEQRAKPIVANHPDIAVLSAIFFTFNKIALTCKN